MATKKTIPLRSEVPAADKWNLERLFKSDAAFEKGLVELVRRTERIRDFKGKLRRSAKDLADCLSFMRDFGILDERLAYYAELRQTEDEGLSESRDRNGRYMMAAVKAQGLSSYITPEIQAIPDKVMKGFLADPLLGEFRIYLERILRFKPHILSEKEERLLALQAEANQTAHSAFSVLTNVDFDFGTVDTPEGKRPLSQSSFSSLML
jgi:oligoendopeptidase F